MEPARRAIYRTLGTQPLFSLYHLWSPWQIPSRIAILLPLIYVVRKKQNIYLSILVHCALNTLLALPSVALIFA